MRESQSITTVDRASAVRRWNGGWACGRTGEWIPLQRTFGARSSNRPNDSAATGHPCLAQQGTRQKPSCSVPRGDTTLAERMNPGGDRSTRSRAAVNTGWSLPPCRNRAAGSAGGTTPKIALEELRRSGGTWRPGATRRRRRSLPALSRGGVAEDARRARDSWDLRGARSGCFPEHRGYAYRGPIIYGLATMGYLEPRPPDGGGLGRPHVERVTGQESAGGPRPMPLKGR